MTHKWDQIQNSAEFRTLILEKRRFIVPAMLFFVVYYFSLPVAAGYLKGIMAIKVYGSLNVAYVFALSQFFMAWTLAFFYVRAANRFDEMAEKVKKTVR